MRHCFSMRAKWRSSPSPRRSVLKNYLTPPTLSERRCYAKYESGSQFPSTKSGTLGLRFSYVSQMTKSALFSGGISPPRAWVCSRPGSPVSHSFLSVPRNHIPQFIQSGLGPVVALKNGLPDKTLKRDDFQVFDNGHPVSIKTFDSAAQFSTRPLALWFVVQCNMQGWEKEGSGLFTGQINLFKPALKDVDKQDTVAVAHWCDNGQSKLDLLPTSNVEEAATALEQVLAPTFTQTTTIEQASSRSRRLCSSSLMLRAR